MFKLARTFPYTADEIDVYISGCSKLKRDGDTSNYDIARRILEFMLTKNEKVIK